MKLEWECQSGMLLPTDTVHALQLQLVVDCCAITEQVPTETAVHVLLTDDAHIHAVNLAQRQVDHATDVLSFPTVRYAKGQTARNAAKQLRREYDAELNACFVGDVLISLPHAQAQAAEYGHSLSGSWAICWRMEFFTCSATIICCQMSKRRCVSWKKKH